MYCSVRTGRWARLRVCLRLAWGRRRVNKASITVVLLTWSLSGVKQQKPKHGKDHQVHIALDGRSPLSAKAQHA